MWNRVLWNRPILQGAYNPELPGGSLMAKQEQSFFNTWTVEISQCSAPGRLQNPFLPKISRNDCALCTMAYFDWFLVFFGLFNLDPQEEVEYIMLKHPSLPSNWMAKPPQIKRDSKTWHPYISPTNVIPKPRSWKAFLLHYPVYSFAFLQNLFPKRSPPAVSTSFSLSNSLKTWASKHGKKTSPLRPIKHRQTSSNIVFESTPWHQDLYCPERRRFGK